MRDSGRVLVKSTHREFGRLLAGLRRTSEMSSAGEGRGRLASPTSLISQVIAACRALVYGWKARVRSTAASMHGMTKAGRWTIGALLFVTRPAASNSSRPSRLRPPAATLTLGCRGDENQMPAALASIRRLVPRAQLPGVSGLARRRFQSTFPASRLLARPCRRPLSRWPLSVSGRGEPARGPLAERRRGAA